VLHLQIVVFTA